MTKILFSLLIGVLLIAASPTIYAAGQAGDAAKIEIPVPDTAPRPLKTKPPR